MLIKTCKFVSVKTIMYDGLPPRFDNSDANEDTEFVKDNYVTPQNQNNLRSK